jgi:hypothetical protein
MIAIKFNLIPDKKPLAWAFKVYDFISIIVFCKLAILKDFDILLSR